MFILWFMFACIIICLPITFIKKYVDTSELKYVFIALSFYCFLTFIYIKLLRYKDISTVYTLLNIVSIVSIFLINVFLFKNKIDFFKITGITFAIISIYFLSIKS